MFNCFFNRMTASCRLIGYLPFTLVFRTTLQGAIVGGVLGFAFPMWISIGAYITEPDVLENLNTSTAGCPVYNTTTVSFYYEESYDVSFSNATLLQSESETDGET